MRIVWAIVLLSGGVLSQELPRAAPNNNDHSAATLKNGVWQLDLVLQESRLFPEADDGYSVVVPLFAATGGPPQSPGPMVRVTQGSHIHVSVRNTLKVPASVYGLHTRPGESLEHFDVPPGETREREFDAATAGNFFYWATTETKPLDEYARRDGLLSGAILVDPKGASKSPYESVFVIQHMSDKGPATLAPPITDSDLWLINGKMWPFRPPLTSKLGEPIVWRWINITSEPHPMHLHGAYFDVLTTGGNESETAWKKEEVRSVVTEPVDSGHSFTMRWIPPRPGNWLFHCHIMFHTAPYTGAFVGTAALGVGHEDTGMSGLVLGIKVLPKGKFTPEPEPANARQIDIFVRETAQNYPPDQYLGVLPKLAVAMKEAGAGGSTDGTAPGPVLVLERDKPVAISVHNQMKSPATVHWHGIELQSYYDGVHHFGGDQTRMTPMIGPGETFTARFTPPRAGTFIYHAHVRDYVEVSSGFYGALLVLPPGQKYDPDYDRVFLIGRDGPDDEKAPFLLNGASAPAPIHVRAGKKYRMRFINITPAHQRRVELSREGKPSSWRPIAKDGADLKVKVGMASASFVIFVGETFDFEWTPESGPEFTLYVGNTKKEDKPLNIHTRIIVDSE